jgi:hypothetical protein
MINILKFSFVLSEVSAPCLIIIIIIIIVVVVVVTTLGVVATQIFTYECLVMRFTYLPMLYLLQAGDWKAQPSHM